MPNIGLVYALSAGADSIRTFDQSASSSSASSMGNDVVTPWPISERSTTTRTLSSAPMRSQALGANAAAAAPRITCRPVAGRWKPMTRPATPAVSRNSRRGICGALMSRSLRGALDGVRAVPGEALDRGHPFAGDGGHGQYAGARRDAVQVDGAGAALGDAAAELGAGEPERVAQHPEERRVGGDVDRFALAVDGEADRGHERSEERRVGKEGRSRWSPDH